MVAKTLTDAPVKMGSFIKIANTEVKTSLEADVYYAVKLENQRGADEAWYMFTERDIERFSVVDMKFGFANMKPGRLYYTHSVGRGPESSFVLLYKGATKKSDGTPIVYRVGSTLLAKGRKRAERNQEDVPRQGWFKDLLD